MLFSEAANKEAYDFRKAKVRARINDPKLQELLAPDVQLHAFGCKRIYLENGFYEIFNQPNVTLVDMRGIPIVELAEGSIKTTTEKVKLDYIVCATGYDAISGGPKNIDIVGRNGEKLDDKWSKGIKTWLGMSVSGFPNM